MSGMNGHCGGRRERAWGFVWLVRGRQRRSIGCNTLGKRGRNNGCARAKEMVTDLLQIW